jgi:pantothenate kinase
VTPDLAILSENILSRAAQRDRLIVAIAGPPAAGKSTLAGQLADLLRISTSVAVVAQDGFHYDNAILEARDQMSVKGAPQTFDVDGFAQLLSRLQKQAQPVAVPIFDRKLDVSRNCAELVLPDDRIVLVEGNYLLTDEAPWSGLAPFFDFSILLDVPIATLRNRLVERWIKHKHTPEQALARASRNDLPNAEYVIAHSVGADLTVSA